MNNFNIKNSKQKQAIIKYLIALGTGEVVPENLEVGICHALEEKRLIESGIFFVSELAVGWKHHSGWDYYPVPICSDLDVVDSFWVTENKWNDSPYNNLRKELCLYVAAKLKAMRLEYK